MPTPDDPWHKTCLRCGGEMEEGHLNGYSTSSLRWISGRYDLSKWTGHPKDWKARRKLSVQTYRCAACGFLDLYAHDEGEES
jgi:ribosomal protein L37E